MVDIASSAPAGSARSMEATRPPAGMRLKYVCDAVPRRRASWPRIWARPSPISIAFLRRRRAGGGDRLVHRHSRQPHPARRSGTEGDLLREAGGSRPRARPRGPGGGGRRRVPCLIGFQRRYDPTFAALKRRLDAGEIGEVEVIAITSRDPAPPPIAYIERSGGIFKDQLIHDFDVCRWILGDEAQTVYAAASCLVDPAIAKAGDADTTAVTIRTRKGGSARSTPAGAPPTATISASRCSARAACSPPESPPHRGEARTAPAESRWTPPSPSSWSATGPPTPRR